MQKKIIAVAIASALAVPTVVLADTNNVTVYGKANLSLDLVDSGTSATVPPVAGTRSNRISSNTSLIGFKGKEDLGNELAAIWQIEQMVDMSGASNTASTLATRNTFAGLSSKSWGTVLLGRHDTPYKLAARRLDQFGDGIADNRSLMGGVGKKSAVASFDGRQPDVIAYISPSWSGFSGVIAYVNLNQALNAQQALATDIKAKAWSLAAMYDSGPFFASLAYEVHDIGAGTAVIPNAAGVAVATVSPTAGKEHATRLGLSYTQDIFAVGLAYEKTSDNFGKNAAVVTGLGNAACNAGLAVGADCFGHNAWYLSGKYNFTGSDAVKLAYTHMGSTAGMPVGQTNAAKQYTLGYDHSMSKRTTLYALYTKLNNSANGSFVLSNNASSVNSTGALNSIAGVGASPSALSFGMRHSF